MNFKEYQEKSCETAIYPDGFIVTGVDSTTQAGWIYPALLLGSEVGELMSHFQKTMRDNKGLFAKDRLELMQKEVGDILWSLAQICEKTGIPLQDCAEGNIKKLADRKARGVLQGSGDLR